MCARSTFSEMETRKQLECIGYIDQAHGCVPSLELLTVARYRHNMTDAKRERWTVSNQEKLCVKNFTPLLADSSLEHLNVLYQEQHYDKRYLGLTACEYQHRQRTMTYSSNGVLGG